MADEPELVISFPDLSVGEAGRNAALLQEMINQTLREGGLPAAAEQRRVYKDAMELGTIVGIVLGAKATIAFFKGLAAALQKYMERTNRSSIDIQRPDGRHVIVTNLESRDVAKVLAALR